MILNLAEEGLNGDKKFTLSELKQIIGRLNAKYGDNAIIGFDAGYNNVNAYLATSEHKSENLTSFKKCNGTGQISEYVEVEARNACDCEAGVKPAQNNVIIGYMDKIDFDCEVGGNPNGNIFFTSIEDLQRERTCSEFCGIVEIEIRLKRVVQESKE